jgi:pilus assembly protein FimV
METAYAGAESPTMETPTVETPYGESPTIEEAGAFSVPTTDRTAEIDLDDLGLDIKDLEELPEDLGDLPVALESETDTREQPALAGADEEDLLSATGVTHVLHGEEEPLEEDEEDSLGQRATSVLDDDDATMLAPGFDDGTMTGTEVLDSRFAVDDESGDTSLVQQLGGENGLDLNLDDLSAALRGGETVEQPRSSSFGGDIFGGDSDTPVDLDVGHDVLGNDEPTGTEEVSPLDPQTMTEVGTKLDLARAYIDMGDPEGARSILEEVLDEGDPNQRREAQSLIDVLSA